MRILISLCLLLVSTCAAFAEEEHAPIWQQGSVLLIQVIGFIILVYVIAKFLIGPINEELETRQKQIADAYDEAEESKKYCDEKKAEYDELIKHADEEAKAILDKAIKESNKIKEVKINETIAECKRKEEIAENNILNEKEKALVELKNTTGKLGVQIASKILNEELDENKHNNLINNFIKDLD